MESSNKSEPDMARRIPEKYHLFIAFLALTACVIGVLIALSILDYKMGRIEDKMISWMLQSMAAVDAGHSSCECTGDAGVDKVK